MEHSDVIHHSDRIFELSLKIALASDVTYHIWNIVMLYIILIGFSSRVQKLPFHSHVTYHIWNIVMLYIILTRFLS